MAVTVSDVENHSSNGWQHLEQDKKQHLLEVARDEVNTLYSGRVSTLDQIKGDKDRLIEYVTAHKYQLAEGGDPSSESGGGGNASYDLKNRDVPSGWTETKWGRQAIDYIRDDAQIGVVRTR